MSLYKMSVVVGQLKLTNSLVPTESMDCLIAVEDFEQCEDESLQRVAWSLVNKYLMRSSNSMLNLSQRKRNSCLVDIGNHIVYVGIPLSYHN